MTVDQTKSEIRETLQLAIREGLALQVEYRKNSGETLRIKLFPLELFEGDGEIYVAAQESGRVLRLRLRDINGIDLY